MRSFKAQYRQAPARAATPPPPVWEPLSPVLRAAAPSATLAAGGTRDETAHSIKHANGSAPGTTQHAPPLASPAASQRTSPAHVETPRRASYAATSPAAAPNDIGQRAPKHAFPRDAAYASAERPAKRARSEHHTSPPYGQHQRPATSHIPGYNVDYMLDNGARMPPAAPPPQANGGEKMLSDAELLLFFSNVSAHTAQTPPSTAKRWSVSQPSPMELAPQQTRQTHEPSSPYAATAHAASHQPQPQPIEDASDTKPSPELIAQPSEVPSAALAPQTQTPPEDTVGGMSQALGQDTAPAEDSKPKKHQGWPKGKPRGPRSTPSTSKRKRSTPKPKSASTASTSAGADQLQSPRSLPAEQPVPMDVDGISPVPRLGDTQAASSQNRRHSFSTSFLHPPSNGASSASFRAQSVPLGGTLVVPPTALDLARPAKQLAPEQPDLICAACKSSDSEIKVGDGEQWIGCDGCKEWYHYACAGFSSEREVRDVNKFYCGPCRPKFGETTSRSTDAQRRYSSNLVQRFASQSESTRPLTTPVSTKASSRLLTTTPSTTTSPLSRMET
jgi:F-box/leucine-rich repeat protein 10/11